MYKIPEKYIQLKNQSVSAPEMAKILYEDGINGIERMWIIKHLFKLKLVEAKEAVIVGDGIANSLDEYQQGIAEDLAQAFDLLENDETEL